MSTRSTDGNRRGLPNRRSTPATCALPAHQLARPKLPLRHSLAVPPEFARLRLPQSLLAGSSHRPQFTGQAKLAQEFVLQQRLWIDLAAGRQNAQGNRQVLVATFLGQVGGRKVQGDAPLREVKACTEQGGTHALA